MRKLLFLVSLTAIVAAALLVPMPVMALAPGPSLAASERVSVEDPRGEITGEILLTTVALTQETLAGSIGAWLDDDHDVLIRPAVIPPGVDIDEYVRIQQQLFEEAVQVAAAVGLEQAGYDVSADGEGARVEFVFPGGPADGELQQGDVIVAVDGEPVRLAADLVAATSRAEAGETVTLTVERGEETRDVDLEVAEVSALGRPAIGAAVRTLRLELDLPLEADVRAPDVGGPSAGLMLALAVYDKATEDDLTRRRIMAGTGAVDLNGRVGSVGGIGQKVAAARDAGATIFLVPEDEADAAKEEAGGALRVAPVSDVEEAITLLRM